METNEKFASTVTSPHINVNTSRIFVSEEIFLALRPRTDAFCFDERHPLSVAPALVGYQLLFPRQPIQQIAPPTIPQPLAPLAKTEIPLTPMIIVEPKDLSQQKVKF